MSGLPVSVTAVEAGVSSSPVTALVAEENTAMDDDTTVIAEQAKRILLLETRNNEIEKKAKDLESNLQFTISVLEEVLEQKSNVDQGENNHAGDEEPAVVALVVPWSATNTCQLKTVRRFHQRRSLVPVASCSSSSGASNPHALDLTLPSTSDVRRFRRSKSLYEASLAGDVGKAHQLLLEGANINYRSNSKSSPLHAAAEKGNSEIIALLIENGVRLNLRNGDGNSPLHLAASRGYSLCVEQFIAAGANINIKNSDGNSPLHLAAVVGSYECVSILVHSGAIVVTRNNRNELPGDITNSDEIKSFLSPVHRSTQCDL